MGHHYMPRLFRWRFCIMLYIMALTKDQLAMDMLGNACYPLQLCSLPPLSPSSSSQSVGRLGDGNVVHGRVRGVVEQDSLWAAQRDLNATVVHNLQRWGRQGSNIRCAP